MMIVKCSVQVYRFFTQANHDPSFSYRITVFRFDSSDSLEFEMVYGGTSLLEVAQGIIYQIKSIRSKYNSDVIVEFDVMRPCFETFLGEPQYRFPISNDEISEVMKLMLIEFEEKKENAAEQRR